MKTKLLILIACLCSLTCFSDDDKSDYSGTIGSISDYSGEDKSGEDVEGLKFNTSQHGGEFRGAIHIAIELTDKNKTVYWGDATVLAPKFKANKQGRFPSGMMEWVFEVSVADMKRPKITGYAVEFGYEDDGDFVVLDADFDDVDNAQELADRNKESESIDVKATKKKPLYDR